jgi:hypothetical protein
VTIRDLPEEVRCVELAEAFLGDGEELPNEGGGAVDPLEALIPWLR